MEIEERVATLETLVRTHDARILERRDTQHKANNKIQAMLEKNRADISDMHIRIVKHDGQIENVINLYEELKVVVEGNTAVISDHNKIMLKAEGGVKTGIWILKALLVTGVATLCTFIATMVKLFEFWSTHAN